MTFNLLRLDFPQTFYVALNTQNGCHHRTFFDPFAALKDVDTMEYILNGDFVMTMFRKIILYDGITLEYSGSDTVVERINSSQPLRKDLLVEVSVIVR